MKSDITDIDVIIHVETQRGEPNMGAVLVSLDGEEAGAVWLPKSQIEVDRMQKRQAIISLPEWLAHEKDLI